MKFQLCRQLYGLQINGPSTIFIEGHLSSITYNTRSLARLSVRRNLRILWTEYARASNLLFDKQISQKVDRRSR